MSRTRRQKTDSDWSACTSARRSSARASKSSRRRATAPPSWCGSRLRSAPARWSIVSEKEKAKILRVLLADDHATVRHGLKLIVEAEADMTVVAEASDG